MTTTNFPAQAILILWYGSTDGVVERTFSFPGGMPIFGLRAQLAGL